MLAAAGADVDPAGTCLLANVQHMIWPYDDKGRLIGEDVWEIDPSRRQIIPLDPAEVLSAQQAAETQPISPIEPSRKLSPRLDGAALVQPRQYE